MYCTKCGVQLRDNDRFCSACGGRTAIGRIEAPPRTLMRDTYNSKIGGVCAGMARYFEVDVTVVRILWLVIAISTGIRFIAYLVAWIVMPKDRRWDDQPAYAPHPAAPAP